jgi:hypothetical protein
MTDLVNPSGFKSPEEFYQTLAAQAGERTQIPAVSSPMVYTDIEDKIEQLRERILRLEGHIERFQMWYEYCQQEGTWQKSPKKLKQSKRKR